MSKTKIFMAIGSVVLASSAFLAAKPAKKDFSTRTSGYIKTGAWAGLEVLAPSALFTNVKNTGHTAFFKTHASAAITLFTSPTGSTLFAK